MESPMPVQPHIHLNWLAILAQGLILATWR